MPVMTPFSFLGGALNRTRSYDDVVRSQVIDSVVTGAGERLMHPQWGCNIRAMLFDPSDEVERADTAQYVKNTLAQQVPRAIVTDVTITADPSNRNLVYIRILYKSAPFAQDQEVTVPVETESIVDG